jgi:hypothetical protein
MEDVGSSLFSLMPSYVLNSILGHLAIVDLQAIALTCKFFHATVIAFLQHEAIAQQLYLALRDFLAANCNLLSLEEQEIFCELPKNKRLFQLTAREVLTPTDRSMLWLLTAHREKFRNTTIRISIKDIQEDDVFLPLTWMRNEPNDSNIWILGPGRPLTRLAFFRQQAKVTFHSIAPGHYSCSVLLWVVDTNYGSNADLGHRASFWSLSCVPHVHITASKWWRSLAEGITPRSELNDGLTVTWLTGKQKVVPELQPRNDADIFAAPWSDWILAKLTAHLQPPSAHLQPPSAHLQPPSAHLQPPSAHLQPPSAHLQPPSAHVQPPSAQPKTDMVVHHLEPRTSRGLWNRLKRRITSHPGYRVIWRDVPPPQQRLVLRPPWVSVSFPEFSITETQNVTFTVKNEESLHALFVEVVLDFVELRKLD